MKVRAAVAIALLSVASCSVTGSTPDEPESSQLRVLTYNLHHGEGVDGRLDLERLAGVIAASAADLVALQEVDRGTSRSGGVDQLQVLAELTGLHSYFAEFFPYQGGSYGLAILSRVPADEQRVISLPPGEREARSALLIQLEGPGEQPMSFACAHLDWLSPDNRRFAQATELAAALNALPGTVLLAGDLNDTPESRTIALLSERLEYRPRVEGARWTFPAPAPEKEIDYVLWRSTRLELVESVVIDEPVASDHRPVLAVFSNRATD